MYADEDFSNPIVAELRRLGHDVLTVHETGQGNRKIPVEAVVLKALTGLGTVRGETKLEALQRSVPLFALPTSGASPRHETR
jgi:hypothetical protein